MDPTLDIEGQENGPVGLAVGVEIYGIKRATCN